MTYVATYPGYSIPAEVEYDTHDYSYQQSNLPRPRTMSPPQMPHGQRPTSHTPDVKPRLTKEQIDILEAYYQQHHKPNTAVKRRYAEQLNVSLEKVNNWFQNRRAKAKQEAKKLENLQLFSNGVLQPTVPQMSALPSNTVISMPSNRVFYPDMYTSPSQLGSDISGRPVQTSANLAKNLSTGAVNFATALDNFNVLTSQPGFGDGLEHQSFDASGAFQQPNIFSDDLAALMAMHSDGTDGFLEIDTGFDPKTAPGYVAGLVDEYHSKCFGYLVDFQLRPVNPTSLNTSQDLAISDPSPSSGADSASAFTSSGSAFEAPVNTHPDWYSSTGASSVAFNTPATQCENPLDVPAVVQGPQTMQHQEQSLPFTAEQTYTLSPETMSPGNFSMTEPTLGGHGQLYTSPEMLAEQEQQVMLSSPATVEEATPLPEDAFDRRDSSTASVLAENFNSFAIQTPPQPPVRSPFKQPLSMSQSIAQRRQRPRPAALGGAALGPAPLNSQALRSASYSGAVPASPGTSVSQDLRRIRSNLGVVGGRITKSGTSSAQRSPLALNFAEGIQSPSKFARHASYSYAGTPGPLTGSSLAAPTPPTPASSSDYSHFPPWQPAPAGLMNPPPRAIASNMNLVRPSSSASPTYAPVNPVQLPVAAGPTYPPPPQSAPATQLSFPPNVFAAPQGRLYENQQFLGGPDMPAAFPEPRRPSLPNVALNGQDLGHPMQFHVQEPMMTMPEELHAQYGPQFSDPFLSTSNGIMAPPPRTDSALQVSRKPSAPLVQQSEFLFQEYKPPSIAGGAKKSQQGDSQPKSYVFAANQGPKDFS